MRNEHRLLVVGCLSGWIMGSLTSLTWHGKSAPALPLASVVEMFTKEEPAAATCAASSTSSVTATLCANTIQTWDWATYRNTDFAIELMHPSTYRVEEKDGKVIIRSAQDSLREGAITLERLRGNPESEIGKNMQRGGWKVRDRTSDVYIGSFFNDEKEPDALWVQYLFVRNSPEERASRRSVMIRATVVLPRGLEYVQDLQKQGIRDPDQVLSGPEEIAATIRFLQFDELNQKRLQKR